MNALRTLHALLQQIGAIGGLIFTVIRNCPGFNIYREMDPNDTGGTNRSQIF